MSFLLELHPILSFLIICSFTVLLSVIGLSLARRKHQYETLKENHEVAAIIFNAFGILYAVVIAFVVFVVWGRYDDAGKNLELEASQAADLFYVARAFPDSTARQIRQALFEYTSTVCEDELKEMSKGKPSPKTVAAVRKLMAAFMDMDSKTLKNPGIYDEAFKRLNDLAQYRRLRIFAAKDSIPLVIWIVLLIGSVIMVTYTYFFGVKKILPQHLMTAALSITLTLILYLVFILDHPFVGTGAISDEPMRDVMTQMKRTIDNQNNRNNQNNQNNQNNPDNQNNQNNPGNQNNQNNPGNQNNQNNPGNQNNQNNQNNPQK